MIEAFLFDMDGVLVDSEEFICKAAIKMFEGLGVEVKAEDFLPFVGAGEDRYLGGVAEKYGVTIDISEAKKSTYEIYDDIVKGELLALPGTIDFINKCKSKGLKIALATSADRSKMHMNLREMGIGEEVFDAIVNGLDVDRKKPFPDIYLEAAKRIGADIEKCIVVEDAVNGVDAANAAGAKCLALTTSFSKEQLEDAEWIIANLSEITEELFEEIIS